MLTMRQLAESLGLNRGTVSAILNGQAAKRGIAAATERRVLESLEASGYVQSRHALGLKARGAEKVGVLQTGLYSRLVDAFNYFVDWNLASGKPFELHAVAPRDILAGVKEMLARGVTRLIVVRSAQGPDNALDEAAAPFLNRLQRMVIYNHDPGTCSPTDRLLLEQAGVCAVSCDRRGGWRELARLLRSLGHSQVALPERVIGLPGKDRTLADLFRAEGLEPQGLRGDDVPLKPDAACARRLAARFLDVWRKERITAVASSNDDIAAFFMVELLDHGVAVPGDVSVTGFNGIELGEALRVPLTTLAMPVEQMAAKTLELLMADGPRQEVSFPMRLVLRKSHGAANPNRG